MQLKMKLVEIWDCWLEQALKQWHWNQDFSWYGTELFLQSVSVSVNPRSKTNTVSCVNYYSCYMQRCSYAFYEITCWMYWVYFCFCFYFLYNSSSTVHFWGQPQLVHVFLFILVHLISKFCNYLEIRRQTAKVYKGKASKSIQRKSQKTLFININHGYNF